MRKYINIYIIFFKSNIKFLLRSKVNFIIGLMVFVLMQIISIFSIQFIFTDFSTVSKEIALNTYGIYLCAKGLDHFFTDNLWVFSMNMVRNGTYSQYVVLPLNSLYLILVEKVQFEAISELIVGFILISSNNVHDINGTLIILGYLIVIINGALFLFSIKLICASLAFFFKTSLSILDLVYNITEFVKYPKYVYSKPVVNVLTYLIPLFVIFNIDINTYNIPLVIGINTILLTIGILLWKSGEMIYDDAGGR